MTNFLFVAINVVLGAVFFISYWHVYLGVLKRDRDVAKAERLFNAFIAAVIMLVVAMAFADKGGDSSVAKAWLAALVAFTFLFQYRKSKK